MVNIGVIGCGGMGRYHSRSLESIDSARIVAAADADENALKNYADEYQPARTYTDFAKLVEDPEVDAVIICLPTYLHHQAVVAAARAGKQVFCEKPIALTLASAEEMIRTCEESGVIFTIGFVRRFDNDWGTFKRLVESNAIGRPVIWRHVMASGGPRSPWYLDKDKGGGPIIDGAIHDIDFANWLFGEVAWTEGVTHRFKSSAFDTATVSIGYESGDELLLSWSWGLPAGAAGAAAHDAIGPGGAVLFPRTFSQDELPSDFDPSHQGAYLVDTGNERRAEIFEKNDMFLEEMKHFVSCCESGEQPAITGEDGLRALRVALRALSQARHM